jgi:hypothetical protein
MTDLDPKLDEAIVALGRTSKVIPFYAVYPANGGPPITFDDTPLTQGNLLAHLQRALDTGNAEAVGVREPAVVGAQR